MERIPASERTRERLKAVMEGEMEAADGRSELVRLAARLIIEEALEGEAEDALGRGYYARGAAPGSGHRNGYRTGSAEERRGIDRVQRTADRGASGAVPLAYPRDAAGPDGGAGGSGGGDVRTRAVDAGHRGAVCRRDGQVAVEPHGSKHDYRAAVGGVRGVWGSGPGRVRRGL